jgi:hypothetical protein
LLNRPFPPPDIWGWRRPLVRCAALRSLLRHARLRARHAHKGVVALQSRYRPPGSCRSNPTALPRGRPFTNAEGHACLLGADEHRGRDADLPRVDLVEFAVRVPGQICEHAGDANGEQRDQLTSTYPILDDTARRRFPSRTGCLFQRDVPVESRWRRTVAHSRAAVGAVRTAGSPSEGRRVSRDPVVPG